MLMVAGAGDDVLDDLAAGSDDVLDARHRNADGGDLRRVLADVGARTDQRLAHLGEDVNAAFASLGQRVGEDLLVDAGDLDVHLDRRDALGGAADLEVHVAEVVLVAEDVGEDGDLVVLLDEAHGDTGDGSRNRNARVHERETAAADGGHRRRAIALEDVGDDAYGVGELVVGRQHRAQRPLRQDAVADFTTARAAQRLHFADRVGREVVVQHELA